MRAWYDKRRGGVVGLCVLLVCGVVVSGAADARSGGLGDRVDWPVFLARQDLVWDTLPSSWWESPFLGNGLLGLTIHTDKGNAVRWNIGRGDVSDHRTENTGKSGVVYDRARLPIGHFNLIPVGKPCSGAMRLDLWNAEAVGHLVTDKGRIQWRAFVHADHPVIVIAFKATGGETDFAWNWVAEESASPRRTTNKLPRGGYKANPASRMQQVEDIRVCVQPLTVKGGYATAWKETMSESGRRVVYISVGNAWRVVNGHVQDGVANGIDDARREAVDAVQKAAETDLHALVSTHRAWWHAYYPASFVSVPDGRIENFYWIQMYKLGAGSRPERPALDLLGPWFTHTIWPAVWCNLNLQLIYYPVYTANRLDQGENLCRMMHANVDNMIKNLRHHPDWQKDSAFMGRVSSFDCVSWGEGGERANLLWMCHNYWNQCAYAADHERMREELFPLLKRAVNYFIHQADKKDDGKWHLLYGMSPEYPGKGPNCNYDLALLRWGCRTLIDIDDRFGLDDPKRSAWEDLLANLVDYPVDENGLMIAEGVPFDRTHRHYSHLLMIYPLYLMNIEQPEHRDLMTKSLYHWIGLKGRLTGYTYTGASSIASALGLGNEALRFLNEGLDVRMKNYITANTMYNEGGNPVMETPLSGAQSVHDMLIQSWGGKIRVFPAVPDAWKDVTFRDLRAQGAFLVSAARRDGKTQWIRVRSLAGGPCLLLPGLEGEVHATVPMKTVDDNVYRLQIEAGEAAFLFSGRQPEVFEMAPVDIPAAERNYYGSKAIKAIREQRDKL